MSSWKKLLAQFEKYDRFMHMKNVVGKKDSHIGSLI